MTRIFFCHYIKRNTKKLRKICHYIKLSNDLKFKMATRQERSWTTARIQWGLRLSTRARSIRTARFMVATTRMKPVWLNGNVAVRSDPKIKLSRHHQHLFLFLLLFLKRRTLVNLNFGNSLFLMLLLFKFCYPVLLSLFVKWINFYK